MTVPVSHTTPAAPAPWTVESQTTPGTFYQVWPDAGPGGHCSCPAYFHRGGPCKHVRQARAEAALLAEALADGLTIVEDGDRAALVEETAAAAEAARQRALAAIYREIYREVE